MDFSILSKHDDILASYFLDNLYLWFKTIRMNSDSICDTGEQQQAIETIRQIVNRPGSHLENIKAGTKLFLQLPYFNEYVSKLSVKEARYFVHHLRRYVFMFSHQAGFEVSSTTRYTGTMEACILATRDWKAGEFVKCCAGAITELTKEDDAKLKSEGRDFSVMVSTRRKCTCLFLGPARFMNHDCDANCEFTLEGANAITFKVQRDIRCGEEMTVYYADHYFGIDNCECRCRSCERLQEGSFYVEKSDSEETEKDDAITPETPSEDENTNIRRSGRTKKEVDYLYKDILSSPKRQKASLTKSKKVVPIGSSNIPLNEITNGKPLEETIDAMTIDNEEEHGETRHSKKHKAVEMDLRFICNEPQQNFWISMPANDDVRRYVRTQYQYDMLYEAQQLTAENANNEYFGEVIHLPLPPLRLQYNVQNHPPGIQTTLSWDRQTKDKQLTELIRWIDDQSDISDSEGSITIDLNVASCCQAAKDYTTVITSTGRELCSRCYRHYKIFGLEWPTRKNPLSLSVSASSSSFSSPSSSSSSSPASLTPSSLLAPSPALKSAVSRSR